MKRRILCVLLALCLLLALLSVTAGAANEDVKWLDVSKGDIQLWPDGYEAERGKKADYTGKYGIYQSDPTRGFNIYIEPSESPNTTAVYDVTFRDLNVTGDYLYNPALWICSDTIVNLTLVGDNLLDTRKAGITCPAIAMFPGSALNITGNGTLTAIGDGFPGISSSGSCTINIFGENTVVKTYGAKHDTTTPPAIREVAGGNLQISVTDGATLEAYGGIECMKLTLDDTVNFWSQAWVDGAEMAMYINTLEYHSDRGVCLYYSLPQFMLYALHGAAEGGSAYEIQDASLDLLDMPSRVWALQNGTLTVNGREMRQGVGPLDGESSLGSWAMLKGKKTVTPTPPVTPVQEPEGDLLHNIIGSGLFFVPEDFPFYDVDSDDWFYEPVKSAWANELIDGVTARYFKPDSTLTVAQAIKLAAALHQKQSVGFVTLQNGGTHWYDNYVNYAVANSLIEAAYQSKSAEDMNRAVTRAEFVHILSKLLNAGTINTVNSIPDVKAGDAYADEIFAFYRAGILTGSDRLGTFHPESSLKRSEAAAILVRLYDATQRQYITLR